MTQVRYAAIEVIHFRHLLVLQRQKDREVGRRKAGNRGKQRRLRRRCEPALDENRQYVTGSRRRLERAIDLSPVKQLPRLTEPAPSKLYVHASPTLMVTTSIQSTISVASICKIRTGSYLFLCRD